MFNWCGFIIKFTVLVCEIWWFCYCFYIFTLNMTLLKSASCRKSIIWWVDMKHGHWHGARIQYNMDIVTRQTLLSRIQGCGMTYMTCFTKSRKKRKIKPLLLTFLESNVRSNKNIWKFNPIAIYKSTVPLKCLVVI